MRFCHRLFGILLLVALCPLVIQANNIKKDTTDFLDREFRLGASLGLSHGAFGFQRNFTDIAFSYSFTAGVQILPEHYLFGYVNTQWHQLDIINQETSIMIDNEWVTVEDVAKSMIFDVSIGLKYEFPQLYYLIPYASFEMGARNLYLREFLRDIEFDEVIESNRLSNEWTYVLTFSGGIAVPLLPELLLSLDVNYARSGSATVYLVPEDTVVQNISADTFLSHPTVTNLITYQLGVTFALVP